jgi:hypothetical protein
MKAFKAKLFIDLAHALGLGEEHWYSDPYDEGFQKEEGPFGRKTLIQIFKDIQQGCNDTELAISEAQATRILAHLEQSKPDLTELRQQSHELVQRVQDEANLRLFFSIPVDRQRFFTEQELFGNSVAEAFPSAASDIEEAGKCLAFERWTSAVFHLSRIAETALITIARRIGYQSPRPGFGEVLKFMDSNLEKVRTDYKNSNPLFKGDVEFLAGVTVQMHAVNQAWRQRVSHMDRKYTEEEALRIWDTTKGLLQQIADKLTEADAS